MFKENMTAEELKALGVKLTSGPYDQKLHFDLTVRGDKVQALQNSKTLYHVVNYNLNIRNDFIRRLEFAEVLDPFCTITQAMQPAHFTVRVYGDVDDASMTLNWQMNDFEDDIKKLWAKLTRQIAQVQAAGEVADNAEALLQHIKFCGMQESAAGIWLTLGGLQELPIQGMLNVRECVRTQEGDTALCFTGKHMALLMPEGMRITFALRNPATGMKDEKEELFIGIYSDARYFRQKLSE